jgi:hypothetical protein
VVVKTYRRTDRLVACLEGLASQTRAPEEVVVVVNAVDPKSAVQLAAARGEIVAFVEDDAVPSENWVEGIVRALSGTSKSAPSVAGTWSSPMERGRTRAATDSRSIDRRARRCAAAASGAFGVVDLSPAHPARASRRL